MRSVPTTHDLPTWVGHAYSTQSDPSGRGGHEVDAAEWWQLRVRATVHTLLAYKTGATQRAARGTLGFLVRSVGWCRHCTA